MKKGQTIDERTLENCCAYLHGRIEAQLEGFAQSLQLPAAVLTGRVAALLLGTQGGALLGTADHLPALRTESSKGRKATRKVAVARRSYRKQTQMKRYWGRMTKEERSKEVLRRRKLAWVRKQQQKDAA